jgi:hypothetical protein
MRTETKLTPAQHRVLTWLYLYPGVHIQTFSVDSARDWTHYWMNEAARQHMLGVMDILGEPGGAHHQQVACKGNTSRGTPRLTKPTFDVLLRNGLVELHRHRPRERGMSEAFYYQISDVGRAVLASENRERVSP